MLLNSSFKKKLFPAEFFSLAGFLIVFLFINDHLIATRPLFPRQIWAIYDCIVHGLVGVLVIYPIYKKNPPRYFFVLFLLAAVVDLDHFIAVRSFSLYAAIHLPLRPVTHSITFAILAAVVGFLLTREKVVSWIFFAALTSHVLRDASGGGTPIFWPLNIYHIPPWLYYCMEIVVLYFSCQVSRLKISIVCLAYRL